MRTLKLFGLGATLVCAAAFSANAQAADSMVLDNESSSLAFVSTKLDHIAEVLSFNQLSGELRADGGASLVIEVDSIDAIFDIRNERMEEHLFHMADFPTISVSAQLDMEAVGAISAGDTTTMPIDAALNLLGTEHQLSAEVLVTNTGEGLVVSTTKPILLSATALGLEEGLVTLAELAGGISISRAVPVSFTLSYK